MHNGVDGVKIQPELLNDPDQLSTTITHELTHEDQTPSRNIGQAVFNQLTGPMLTSRSGITHQEKKYLKEAYHLNDHKKDQYGETGYNEMQATNRQLRHMLQQDFIDEFGRQPQNIDEFDHYIQNIPNEALLEILKTVGGYGYLYGNDINTNEKGWLEINFTDIDKKAEAVKQALIHVAQNNSGFQKSGNMYFAKSGGTINYLKFFK